MRYSNIADFLSRGRGTLARGPVAMIFAEDAVELDTTIRHHRQLGFPTVLVFADPGWSAPDDLEDRIHRIEADPRREGCVADAVSRIAQAAPGQWMYYCYNAEYLFYPFCETRSVPELLAFHAEERRDAMLTYVIDLYAGDLGQFPDGVSLDDTHIDTVGYYAQVREDQQRNWAPKERQLDFYGGLRWRFEEFVPWERRRIDRIGLFRAKKGLTLRDDHTFSDEEYNTYACQWHNNLTAAVASFRTAKALKANPGSRWEIGDFRWHKSAPFEWHSRQLLDLGLIEAGQWF
ncbi:glycosyltransferase family 2 protein [Thetidibacter halocola]|uniref:Glycosyl transferase family 2 n=1 Tax=Thetidibacter halocola TaxID=2827239 RepID=A0A8J8B8I6_9RHOB|nr:hypothetical protein [Thetidibacter halocola]MBS0124590.1 hypothetical protein [Thetidibacter halocola]